MDLSQRVDESPALTFATIMFDVPDSVPEHAIYAGETNAAAGLLALTDPAVPIPS
jgi:hypothetical protein